MIIQFWMKLYQQMMLKSLLVRPIHYRQVIQIVRQKVNLQICRIRNRKRNWNIRLFGLDRVTDGKQWERIFTDLKFDFRLYVHSAIGEHRTTIGKVWLHHAIYSIVHNNGRIFVSLANEKIVVFHRNSGRWNYFLWSK